MIPSVAIIDRSLGQLPWPMQDICHALTEYAGLLSLAWPVRVSDVVANVAILPGMLPILLAEHSDDPGALAYHALDEAGPWGQVFVQDTLADGKDLATVIGHEFAEMLADPWCQLTFPHPRVFGCYLAGEIVDPVQETIFITQAGLRMPNFVYPAWFGLSNPPEVDATMLDHLGLCSTPGQVLEGGYISVWEPRRGWHEVWGDHQGLASLAAKRAVAGSRINRRRG